MILIAHRGNYQGRNIDRENHPDYIQEALDAGYDCEVDVWYLPSDDPWQGFWLGHDKPEHKVDRDFLNDQKLWCHAKNHEALRVMLSLGIHCFWHNEDDYTITSKGWIWAYPGKKGDAGTITVMPETTKPYDYSKFSGICSDDLRPYE